jgi:hypothetical protein
VLVLGSRPAAKKTERKRRKEKAKGASFLSLFLKAREGINPSFCLSYNFALGRNSFFLFLFWVQGKFLFDLLFLLRVLPPAMLRYAGGGGGSGSGSGSGSSSAAVKREREQEGFWYDPLVDKEALFARFVARGLVQGKT